MKFTKSEKKVWTLLTNLAKTTKQVTIKVTKLAELLDLSEKTIRNATAALHEAKLIRKVEQIVKDHRTGLPKQIANKYIILSAFSDDFFTAGGKKICRPKRSFKTFKKINNFKKEEEAIAPITSVSSPSPVKQTTITKQPTTPEEVKETMSAELSQFHPFVVQQVLKSFLFWMKRKTIHTPILWIRKCLKNAQELFDRTGVSKPIVKVPVAKSRTTGPVRPQIEMPKCESPVVAPSCLERIRALARQYDKEKTASAV